MACLICVCISCSRAKKCEGKQSRLQCDQRSVKEQERSRVKIDVNHRWLDLADPRDQKAKTINIRDSLVVTHPTTSLTAQCFSTAERTGSPIFIVLWSIARITSLALEYMGSILFVRDVMPRSWRAPFSTTNVLPCLLREAQISGVLKVGWALGE
jgi:hypothetical protein